MADDDERGLSVDPDPRTGETLEGGPGEQRQRWPGSEKALRPPADHGEHSYRGSDRLRGRKALVTGGDSGIGRAVTIAFAREGADVCIAYYDEDDDAAETMRWVEEAGRAGEAVAADLAAPGPVWTPLIPATRSPEKVAEFGADTFWKRAAQPAELAPTYVFLASPDSRFITGEIVGVTGRSRSTR